MSSRCAWEWSKAWALGMVAAALAIAIVALGVGTAVRVGYHRLDRVCARGHDDVTHSPDGEDTYTRFVCDDWAPKPNATATP